MVTAKTLQYLVYGFLAVIVAIVFQQINTSMTEQGIASGGPYNNGAAYPRSVAIAIMVLMVGQFFVDRFAVPTEDAPVNTSDLRRPVLLLIVFAIYLGVLKTLGYHLTTTPLIFAIMLICGARNLLKLALVALTMSFVFAFIFEKFLNVVLPGGIFSLNIAW
ncbi:tripartite tricarboxylate transporter TctB family protein [uncultured Ruegeria sp.]|uniref:tripartite tricarboxylate transporter TctB family protein n=1 Tax=uncultured Ruegeria sp. TaxID=259304 RepID=UPI00260966AC|nr:tripartite tricarboxylate transporter TctB family protein [uncultured Ruegeria sp.]